MTATYTGSDTADHEAPRQSTDEFFSDLMTSRPVMYGPEWDLLLDYRLPDRTAAEEDALREVADEVTLVVAQNRIETICDSAKEMLEQTGSAPGAKWGDLIVGIFTATGTLAVSATSGVPAFSACASAPLQYVVKTWTDEDTVGINKGDVFYHNDARYGGVHNADQSLFLPVFAGDVLVAWVGATIHEGENGAREAGGMAATAQSVYDEGLKISPVKVAENYRLRRDIVNLFQNNVRDPLLQLADMRSKLAACMRVEAKLDELIGESGPAVLVAAMRQALEQTRDSLRKNLAELPDGIYRGNHFLDTTVMEDRLLKSCLELRKSGDRLLIRTAGSAPLLPDRPINAMPPFTRAMMTITLMHFFWTESARNAGYPAALDFDIEPGTFAHGDFEAPNGLCQISTCAWQTLIHLCMSKLVYNNPGDIEIVAPWYGITQAMTYGGINQWGLPQGNLMIDINSQGGGGHADRDGEDSVSPFFAVMADYGEIEDLETELPILTLGRNLMINNHGFGRHRGGAGVECMYMVWGVPEWFFGAVGAGSRFPNVPGLFGGYGGPSTPLTVFRAESPEKVRDALASRAGAVYTAADVHDNQLPGSAETRRATQSVQPNRECDLWILQTGGGGGFGDVLERDPQSVIEDVRLGRITERVAREVYQVRFDADTFLLDEVATDRARNDERADRLRRGKTYDEFVAGWRRDTPPAHLDFLGDWHWDEDAR